MKIAIPTIWFKRGQSYISLAMRQALVNASHEVFIYARLGGVGGTACMESTGEFDIPNVTAYPAYEIPPDIFSQYLETNDIDVVLFNEEQYQKGLAKAARKTGCKIAGYVCREFINPDDLEYYTDYDAVICPTKHCYDYVKELGLPAHYVKWGVDLNLFKPANGQIKRKDDTVRFFHPAGWGGMCERRGTKYAVEAFKKADISNAKLLVHMQSVNGSDSYTDGNIIYVKGNLTREDLIKYYQYSDVAVLPSKHEGLGLTYLEAQACGLSVLGIDAPPMNEHVIEPFTGINCKIARFEDYPENVKIFVKSALVDIDDLVKEMKNYSNSRKSARDKNSQYAIRYARDECNWNENGKELVGIIENL